MKTLPFTLSPNPAWMYLTPSTLRSLETIRWVIDDCQGLAMIFGDAGLGKSSLLRWLQSEYADEERYTTGFLTRVDFRSPYAFMKRISDEFSWRSPIPGQRSLAAQNAVFEEFLISESQADRTVILFLDEGQELSGELLEVLRNLLNFETNIQKLIQVIVAGQVELLDTIRAKKNQALASRVFSPVLLEALTEEEGIEMIKFRCERAHVPCPFSDDAIRAIHQLARGIPRQMVRLCARAVKREPAPISPPIAVEGLTLFNPA